MVTQNTLPLFPGPVPAPGAPLTGVADAAAILLAGPATVDKDGRGGTDENAGTREKGGSGGKGGRGQQSGARRRHPQTTISPHLLEARRLSRKMRALKSHADVQTLTGRAICQHLRLLLQESERPADH